MTGQSGHPGRCERSQRAPVSVTTRAPPLNEPPVRLQPCYSGERPRPIARSRIAPSRNMRHTHDAPVDCAADNRSVLLE